MKSFTHHNAKSLREAVRLLVHYQGKAKPTAGGTDLLGVLKEQSLPQYPEAIINLKTIPGLAYIQSNEGGLRIGALTSLTALASSPVVKEHYRILSDAARSVATPQIRNMCTIAGNLAQDVRCWYYRYPEQLGGPIKCLRKGGKLCNALSGDNRYHSIFGAAALVQYPCSSQCPTHADIPSYLGSVKQGNLMAAAQILMASNPLAAITGRVCPIYCEPECNRKTFDEPVAIRCIERSLGDFILEKMEKFFSPPQGESGKGVAVIGSGPAGLSAAYYLRKSGHQVTIYERLSQAGGMLRYAIPPYRLPKDVVDRQIQALEGMGITFDLGATIGKDGTDINDLMGRFDAVFAACGAWKEKTMSIQGEHLASSGLAFLNQINAGDTTLPGKNVAVIGGGNVAMDVARTLLRLGAKPVVIYRRTEKEMPAFKDEYQKAREEGIKFQFLTLPTKASRAVDKISLECVRMKLGAPDASGRPQPAPKAGSEFSTTFDAVIKAVGETPDTSFLPARLRKKKALVSGFVGRNLFAGGDFVSGPSTVIQAVAAGKEKAHLIESFFLGQQVPCLNVVSVADFVDSVFDPRLRMQVPEIPSSERTRSIYTEDSPGFSVEDAENEARRCFNCGCVAVNPSDVGIALVALDAQIVTTKRMIDAQSFFESRANSSTILDPDELITEIQISKSPEGSRQAYLKFTLRKPVDFAIASVASVITEKDGICKDARIVLGGVAPKPIRALTAEEAIKDGPIDEDRAVKAAELAVKTARSLSKNGYKVQITKTLVKRSLIEGTVV